MSKSERFDKNWDDLARQLNYINRRDMLEDMYVIQNMSLKEIGSRIGCSSHAVMHQLDKLDITRRSRGGSNNTSLQTRKLFRLDQRFILGLDIPTIAKHTQTSTSLVYKYRRVVKENVPWSSVFCHAISKNSNVTEG